LNVLTMSEILHVVQTQHCFMQLEPCSRNHALSLSRVCIVCVYSTPSVGPGADPDVQAVSPQVTVSHPPGGRLPLLSARPAVTSQAAEHHRPLAGTKLYCLVTEALGVNNWPKVVTQRCLE